MFGVIFPTETYIAPTKKGKGTFGVFNMRGMWVILFVLCVCYSAVAEENFTFGTIGHATDSVFYTAGGLCDGGAVYGSACLASFVETSNEMDNYYPFSFSFSKISSAVSIYKKMLEQDCLGTMDGYYKITMNRFAKPTDSQCSEGSIPYHVLNDCQNIDMSVLDSSDIRSPLHPDNYMCAILCNYGFAYSNTGACMEYCKLDGEIKRLRIINDDMNITIPLWKNSYTTPALHIRFSDKQVCHMNLTTEKQTDALNVLYQNTLYYSTK